MVTSRQARGKFANAFAAFVQTDVPYKLAVMMCGFLPAQLAAAFVIWWTTRESGVVRMAVLDESLLYGIGVVAFGLVISWIATARHWPGKPVLYVALALYSSYMVHLVHVLGMWSTPYLMLVPVVAFVCGVVFGPRAGWFSLGTSTVLIVVTEVLRFSDVLEYAPAVRHDAIGASPNGWWVASAVVPLAGFVIGTFTMTMAVVLAAELQARRLDMQAETLRRSHAMIRRYVPSQVVDAVVAGGESVTAHERRKVTVFFSDIVGFTEMVDRMEPEELSRVLNDYFTAMTLIAEKYDGTIDELIGDAVLILFGAPSTTNDRDHAMRAVRMALDMQASVGRLNAEWMNAGIDAEMRVRMAIDTGVVTVGNFGSSGRMKYAALGRAVNVAARLQTLAVPGRLLVSHPTFLLVREAVAYEEKGEVELKGVHHPIRTYEIEAMVP
ncbi:hypothetical protein ASD11_13905 [Aeromicrobium sp. Root495]|uniref:adenylate/guanylate cyclase domain-containing protein n=1 Tax=Aeromicrobium sp. Root495 TaxID=1736550 RepID=UPI0006FACF99|nr:adenylate/guanylate cyclase domain-containing protein [Aeromicrobium sp. Root495]KQY60532.1 hypothetical protein ASD11_13905 [Aeromicrobium sp. Root495]